MPAWPNVLLYLLVGFFGGGLLLQKSVICQTLTPHGFGVARDEKYIGGLCGAIARTVNIDRVLVRIGFVFVFVTLVTGGVPGIVTYLFGWAVPPTRTTAAPLARLFVKSPQTVPLPDAMKAGEHARP